MSEVGLHTLAVVHAAMPHRRARCPNGDVAASAAHVPVPVLSDLIHNLVESGKDVVRKLHLGDRLVPRNGQPDSHARDRLLAEWCIHHPLRAELVPEPDGATEDTAKGHVLTKNDGLGLCSHSNMQGIVDGGHHGHPLGGPLRRWWCLTGRRSVAGGLHRRQRAFEVAVAAQVVVSRVLANMLLHLLPLLLQVPRHTCVYVREHLPEWPTLLGLTGLEGSHDVRLCPRLELHLLLIAPCADGLEVGTEARYGTLSLPLHDLVSTPVRL
mmetsp:Transcript_45573/g.114868  ORF Transcript_45573/g.114868 Transcript_45573/m.114868 type:complete len:268 (+) Transcript_45573:669-1472(+)